MAKENGSLRPRSNAHRLQVAELVFGLGLTEQVVGDGLADSILGFVSRLDAVRHEFALGGDVLLRDLDLLLAEAIGPRILDLIGLESIVTVQLGLDRVLIVRHSSPLDMAGNGLTRGDRSPRAYNGLGD